jgi:hypothetical protein
LVPKASKLPEGPALLPGRLKLLPGQSSSSTRTRTITSALTSQRSNILLHTTTGTSTTNPMHPTKIPDRILSDFCVVRSRNPVSSSVILIYLWSKLTLIDTKILPARCPLADVLSSACGTPPSCHLGLTPSDGPEPREGEGGRGE